ncbi:exocyst complex component 3-like protein 4 [Salminus brasiliensis]|uniref:exocyst complex component 3-like protein 4 n=1 Tax=Salminus brasiliensis TaxID=930266 RepID=UPI003B830ACF
MASCYPCRRLLACFCSELHDDDNGKDGEDLPVILSHRKLETLKTDLKKDSPERTQVEKRNSVVCEVSQSFIHNIPDKPLSAIEINELLKSNSLKEAYPHLQSLHLEFQREQEALGEKTSLLGLTSKEKDLSLLYGTLRTKVIDIIRHSSSLPSCNKELLCYVAFIIQEEENRKDLGRMKGWRDAWSSAVQDSVRDTLKGVQLDSREENASWLAVHLGHLGKVIVELLEKVKTELVDSYPSNFNVFETYVSSCHEVVGEHLKKLLEKITELKDYYSMLDFIINQYHSEKILGSPSLQPEMEKLKALTLPDADQIKEKYCNCLQEDLNSSLSKIIKLEKEDVWRKKDMPQSAEDGRFIISEIHIDISKLIAGFANNSGKIDANLKKRVLCTCLEALKHFPKRFEEEFTKQSSSLLGTDLLDCCLYSKYHVAYTNSFSSLKEHMEGYRESCPGQISELGKEVDRLLLSLRQALLKQLKVETEPFMKIMMTKTWLKTNDDFKEIMNRLEIYSGFGRSMKPLPAQLFANDMHYHVVKEYISQLLMKKYTCKGKKNKLAADKIRDQWDDLRRLFSDMGSTLDWLHPLGDHLSKIIEQENEKDIINFLEPLVENYPDMSEKQLSAILYFRNNDVKKNLKLKLNQNKVIQRFNVLKQNCEKKNTFFSDITV